MPEMLFGAHMSIAGGMHKAILRGRKATCDTIQIFDKSNNQWRAAPLRRDDLDRYFELIETTGITVATAHSSYLINIASPDPVLFERSLASLLEEMDRCQILRIPNLVLHPGSHVGSGEITGLRRVAEAINTMFDRLSPANQVTLLLETTSGQGTNLGYRFEHLAEIIGMVEDAERMGVCLDTCHVFSAGYALAPLSEYRSTMSQFDAVIGLERLRVIHVNDSKKPLGSRRDRHEHIGKGYIGLEGFRHLVNDPALAEIPRILETPKGPELIEDIENLAVLRSLVRKPRRRKKTGQ
jgi:deoxyribonuclease IV